jgi:hypothetical protein
MYFFKKEKKINIMIIVSRWKILKSNKKNRVKLDELVKFITRDMISE